MGSLSGTLHSVRHRVFLYACIWFLVELLCWCVDFGFLCSRFHMIIIWWQLFYTIMVDPNWLSYLHSPPRAICVLIDLCFWLIDWFCIDFLVPSVSKIFLCWFFICDDNDLRIFRVGQQIFCEIFGWIFCLVGMAQLFKKIGNVLKLFVKVIKFDGI